MASRRIMTDATEHELQCTLMSWWTMQCRKFKVPEQLLYAIPNGGHRNIITAKKLKNEGVRAGVPDLFLAVPRGIWHGMYLELKRNKHCRPSDAQAIMLKLLDTRGYHTVVAHSFDEAVDAIKKYLGEEYDDSAA